VAQLPAGAVHERETLDPAARLAPNEVGANPAADPTLLFGCAEVVVKYAVVGPMPPA
jgi:hypothetical protein